MKRALVGGEPLSDGTRSRFERQFGTDFTDVRIHTGRRADEATKALRAKAFTVGAHIAFARGRFDLHSREGTALLAHELTHVVQQRTSASRWRVQRQVDDNGERDGGHDGWHRPRRYPELRRAVLSVEPQPTSISFLAGGSVTNERRRRARETTTDRRLVMHRIAAGDDEMVTALWYAVGPTTRSALWDNLTDFRSWLLQNPLAVSEQDFEERQMEIALENYLEHRTERTREDLVEEYVTSRHGEATETPGRIDTDPERTLYFDFDSTEFNTEMTTLEDWVETVDQVAAYIRLTQLGLSSAHAGRTPTITVEGYASPVGPRAYNEDLAEERAETIARALRRELARRPELHGIDYEVAAVGRGEAPAPLIIY